MHACMQSLYLTSSLEHTDKQNLSSSLSLYSHCVPCIQQNDGQSKGRRGKHRVAVKEENKIYRRCKKTLQPITARLKCLVMRIGCTGVRSVFEHTKTPSFQFQVFTRCNTFFCYFIPDTLSSLVRTLQILF